MIKRAGLIGMLLVGVLISAMGCRPSKAERFDPINQTISGAGVGAPVKVVRDRFGIVHVEAENQADLFYAAGFAMAQDRFFQMDVYRRAGGGRISALLGSPVDYKGVGLPNLDAAARCLRFEESAQKGVAELDPASRAQLDAFTRGVNEYLKQGGSSIAIYQTFKTAPEPWRMEDSFLVAGVMGFIMAAPSIANEYYLGRIRRELGEEARDLFVPVFPDDEAIITNDRLLGASAPFFLPRPLVAPGSNNWVMAGSRTKSGLPILANDPHVPISIVPTFWWHCHLKGGGYDVMGLMFSGLPCFGAATNGKIGWALTNVMADYIDLWREKLNPADPRQYQVDGKWESFELRKEEIAVRGKKSVPLTLKVSRHGVVIDKETLGWEVASDPGEVLAMKYVDLDFARFFQGYQAMALAQNRDEWLAGARNEAWGPFAWNHMFADASGDIAYWTTGHFPIRHDNRGYIPRKGWRSEEDWKGYVAFEENPHLVNPQKGYLASANNRVQMPDYPYYLTIDYLDPARARRISEMIESSPRHDVEDVKKMQYDTVDLSTRPIVEIILADLAGTDCPQLQTACDLVREFKDQGYDTNVDSAGTCVVEVFLQYFPEAVFGDELDKSTARGVSLSGLMGSALANIMNDPSNKWFDDQSTSRREVRKDIVARTMRETMKYLTQKLGPNSKKWRWGDLSFVTMSPSFVPIPGLSAKMSLGPYEIPGTMNTVRAGDQIFLGPLGFMGFMGPSTHFIVDFQDPRRALFNCSAGMAEWDKGGRYGNLTPDWLAGEYGVMSMDKADYEKDMMGAMKLMP